MITKLYILIIITRSSNIKDDATFRYTPIRHSLDSTSVTVVNWWSATSAGKYRECVQNANNILSIIPFSKASFLNREAHNVLLLFGLSEILIMQAPVPECSESEDDEVDPPLTASRSDSGTVSSWDAATCGKCTTAYWYKRDLEVSILALLMNFGEYLWYIKNRLFLNLW